MKSATATLFSRSFLPKLWPARSTAAHVAREAARINFGSARELRRAGFNAEATRGCVSDGDGGNRLVVDDAVWTALCALELDAAR
jgi:hypothetical protein